MNKAARFAILAAFAGAALFGAFHGYLSAKRPVRSGALPLQDLTAPVSVRYDDFGVPHINARNQADLYRALGYVHAQDRLFQMELARRLARGELAEVLGAALVDTDRLFRTLRIRDWADAQAAQLNLHSPAAQSLTAYLDGVNQFVAHGTTPIEFDLLGIPKRPFTVADTLSVTGYLAYSFASAFKTEAPMSYVRDELGPDYLKIFDLDWHGDGVIASQRPAHVATNTAKVSAQTPVTPANSSRLDAGTWAGLADIARLSSDGITEAGLAQLTGSNAWVLAGSRTASGKPLLAGDPHISFANPAVWYEAHLSAPGFTLYGHFPSLVPAALLGLNERFAWSLTMFQNDDIDMVREAADAPLSERHTHIAVKGAASVPLTLRDGPHGPILNDAFPLLQNGRSAAQPTTPIALWWTLYHADNSLLDAMYALNRADTRAKARAAVSTIHAPGLNVLWASADGDIAWWGAGKLPRRPAGVNPRFLLDASKGEAEKLGWHPFSANPQEENPARGYIVSANHQPLPASGIEIPGYYSIPARAERLDSQLADPGQRWTVEMTQSLQLDSGTAYAPRTLALLLPLLRAALSNGPGISSQDATLIEVLAEWDGRHELGLVAPTVFNQLLYEIPRAAMEDDVGAEMFLALVRVNGMDRAIPRLLATPDSVWWDKRGTAKVETRTETVLAAWQATLAHLSRHFGPNPGHWTWARAHTLTHKHPLGSNKWLAPFFNIGPFPVPGGHETPNNLSNPIGPLPLAVTFGPSTRRIIDFGSPDSSVGINPVGQSGVRGDAHFSDQAARHVAGHYRRHHLSETDVAANTRSVLELHP